MKGIKMGITERKGREKEHRKEEIWDAAQKIFFEKGLGVATMDEIADSAELSKGTLYLYYKSKEDLYLAVAMRGFQFLHEGFEKIMNEQPSVIKALVSIGQAYIDFSRTHRNYFRMFNFLQTPHFHKQVSEEMRELCNAETYKNWDRIIGLVKRGIQEGLIRSDLDPVEVTIIIWSSATSLLLRHDNEGAIWKEKMKIDLMHALDVSMNLFYNSIFTETGRSEYAVLQK
jgi:TetR/AcrR family transcriptional regulator